MRMPFPIFSSLGAYLRQTELSLHRADSMQQLTEFLASRSVRPRVVQTTIADLTSHGQVHTTADWSALFRLSRSLIYEATVRFKSMFRDSGTRSFRSNEIACIIEALSNLEEFLCNESPPSQDAINELRQKLSVCSDLILLRISNRNVRTQIQYVEHLNSAPHLSCVPIQDIEGWPWGPENIGESATP